MEQVPDECTPFGELKSCLTEAEEGGDLDTEELRESFRRETIPTLIRTRIEAWFPDWLEYPEDGEGDECESVYTDHPGQIAFSF